MKKLQQHQQQRKERKKNSDINRQAAANNNNNIYTHTNTNRIQQEAGFMRQAISVDFCLPFQVAAVADVVVAFVLAVIGGGGGAIAYSFV